MIDGSNASTYNAETFEPSPGSDNIMAMRMMNAPEYRSADSTMMATIPRYVFTAWRHPMRKRMRPRIKRVQSVFVETIMAK